MPVSARRRPKPKTPDKPALPAPKQTAGAWLAVAALAVAAVAAAVFLVLPGLRPAAPLEPGLIERVESLYNDISVTRQPDGNLLLSFGAKRLRYTESIVNPGDPLDLPVAYTQSMTAGLAYAAGLDDAMIIGLGGGRTAWYHHKSVPGLRMTAVELDPEVVRLADRYFGVHPEPGFEVEVMDGRVWLTKTDRMFDIILIDAYRGPFVPFHLLTTEFYALVARHLKPGGVVVQNIEPTTMLFDPAVATIRSAFEHVAFLGGRGNIVVVAYNGPEMSEPEIAARAASRQTEFGFRYDLAKVLARRFAPTVDATAKPLTDDFAPVEYLKAIERHNERQE